MAQRGAEGEGGHLTQTLGEKMAAVMARYGSKEPERPNARPCVICEREVADPLMAGHLLMHDQAERCPICGHAGKLEEHLAHLRREGATRDRHEHGEPTEEQRVVGEAVKAVITAELDGLELVAQKFYEMQSALAYLFGYGSELGVFVPWDDLKARHRAWLVATVQELIKDGVIRCG
jgi:hypothetical protein